MCGIVGYVGPQDARDVVLEGLRRLEYRGYDSAGVAVLADGALATAKKAGKLANLEKELADRPLPAATTAIGHTRWATHGGPTDRNAHPHVSADARVAVVHTASSRTSPRCAPSASAPASSSRPRPTPRWLGTCSPPRTPTPPRARAVWPRRCGRSAAGSRAPSPWSPPTPTSPTRWSPRAAAARSWSASATASTSWAPTSRP